MTFYQPILQNQKENCQNFLKPKSDMNQPATIQHKSQPSKQIKRLLKATLFERKFVEALDWRCVQNSFQEKNRKKKKNKKNQLEKKHHC